MKVLEPTYPPVDGVPVDYDRVPSIIARRIRAAFCDYPLARHGGTDRVVCGWAIGRSGPKYCYTFDHWGRIGDSLICEPYAEVDDDWSRLQQIADAIGCDLEVSAESEWNPPHTVRLTLTPRPDWTPPPRGERSVHPWPDDSF